MSEEVSPLEEELQAKIEAQTKEAEERRQALIRQGADEGTYFPSGINMLDAHREIDALQAELAATKGSAPVEAEEPVEEAPAEEPVEELTEVVEGVEEPVEAEEPEAEPAAEETPEEAPAEPEKPKRSRANKAAE